MGSKVESKLKSYNLAISHILNTSSDKEQEVVHMVTRKNRPTRELAEGK
tara:strand:- start:174 stop:320 length:147 start_codon:yes stop_codon:yes gene_type:complete